MSASEDTLRQGCRLCVTFRPSFRDARHWHDRDFTVIDLHYGPRDWIELAQIDRSGKVNSAASPPPELQH